MVKLANQILFLHTVANVYNLRSATTAVLGFQRMSTAQSMSIVQVVESAGLFPAESLYGLVGDV